jgi:metallo-beta-lactamase family protein
MESTYGDRLHPESDPAETVQSEINAIEKTCGTLLIPAFALERTQELLHMIMHFKKAEKILPLTPIYLDSPMAEKATAFYMKYPEIFNPHTREEIKTGNAFRFPGLDVLEKRSDSQALYRQKGGKVIIAGSGMMSGGRILGHAAHYLPISSTRLLIVGFQGEGTIGRELLEGARQVVINGVTVQVNANVNSTQAMSSHADQGQLTTWLEHIKNVKKVILTHGENDPRKALSQKISEKLGINDVTMPELNQEISF